MLRPVLLCSCKWQSKQAGDFGKLSISYFSGSEKAVRSVVSPGHASTIHTVPELYRMLFPPSVTSYAISVHSYPAKIFLDEYHNVLCHAHALRPVKAQAY